MSGNFVISDKDTETFWSGTDWRRNYQEAMMFFQADEAIQTAQGLTGTVNGPIQVLNGYTYTNQPPVWSSAPDSTTGSVK